MISVNIEKMNPLVLIILARYANSLYDDNVNSEILIWTGNNERTQISIFAPTSELVSRVSTP